ncbi:MAG: DUF1207 domain-containing protein [Planctomycetes bacterium]|nr:DUF1207 domain-containing protein [Planctomycetota bacterium]
MSLRFAVVVALFGTSLSSVQAQDPSPADDARSAGYLQAILERELGWEPGTYALQVRAGIATIGIHVNDRAVREPQVRRLVGVPGVTGVELVDDTDVRAGDAFIASGGGLPGLLGLSSEDIAYPQGDVFEPLLADPKTPRFFASLRHYDTPDAETTGAAVGFGESFGLWKRSGRKAGDGLQVGLSAGLFAQFDLETASADLINADYVVGVPLTWREGRHAARLRLYHQSSHLGDEFLLAAPTDRINLSFESLELLYSLDLGAWRGYLGGEFLLHRDPRDLERWGGHAGLELRGTRELFGGRPVAGLDLKSWEEHSGALDAALSFGIELDSAQRARRTRWMFDLYHGYAPHGQFYDDRIWFAGFGLQLAF